jgi:hypothetical protein
VAEGTFFFVEKRIVEPLIFKNPHWEALTPHTQSAFHLLGNQEVIKRFYLAGGTGLALHLGHRFSIDLDFFSESPEVLGSDERAALRLALEDRTLAITQDKEGTLVASWKDVGISFFRLDQYPVILPFLILDKVFVASVEEIGAMKIAAILGRGTRKDFIDMYFILQQVSLEDLFRIAALKYAHVRTFAISALRAMTYFEDAEAFPMPQMLDRTPWPQMKRFLEKQAIQAGRQHLEDLWEE